MVEYWRILEEGRPVARRSTDHAVSRQKCLRLFLFGITWAIGTIQRNSVTSIFRQSAKLGLLQIGEGDRFSSASSGRKSSPLQPFHVVLHLDDHWFTPTTDVILERNRIVVATTDFHETPFFLHSFVRNKKTSDRKSDVSYWTLKMLFDDFLELFYQSNSIFNNLGEMFNIITASDTKRMAEGSGRADVAYPSELKLAAKKLKSVMSTSRSAS